MDKRTMEAEFWRRVPHKGANDCWEWQGWKWSNGYGGLSYMRARLKAHRLSWAFANGKPYPPPQVYICHTCDNPPCVNPKHLFEGNALKNNRDKISKGREPRFYGEQRWHKLTEAEVIEVRKLYAQGNLSCRLLGEKFNCSASNIHCIVTGKTWPHLPLIQ